MLMKKVLRGLWMNCCVTMSEYETGKTEIDSEKIVVCRVFHDTPAQIQYRCKSVRFSNRANNSCGSWRSDGILLSAADSSCVRVLWRRL